MSDTPEHIRKKIYDPDNPAANLETIDGVTYITTSDGHTVSGPETGQAAIFAHTIEHVLEKGGHPPASMTVYGKVDDTPYVWQINAPNLDATMSPMEALGETLKAARSTPLKCAIYQTENDLGISVEIVLKVPYDIFLKYWAFTWPADAGGRGEDRWRITVDPSELNPQNGLTISVSTPVFSGIVAIDPDDTSAIYLGSGFSADRWACLDHGDRLQALSAEAVQRIFKRNEEYENQLKAVNDTFSLQPWLPLYEWIAQHAEEWIEQHPEEWLERRAQWIEQHPEDDDGSAVPGDEPEHATQNTFPFNTSKEWALLQRAVTNGKTGKGWRNMANTRVFSVSQIKGYVTLELTEDDEQAGYTVADLEKLTDGQDIDGAISLLYVSNILAGIDDPYSGAWFKFDDIIPKLGWTVKNTAHRRECHRQIYDYLRFGAIASIEGDRGTYRVPGTNETVSTQISGPLWNFMNRERPIQPSLFPGDAPVSIEIVLNPNWKRMLSDPLFIQYLSGAELLSEVPSEQPGGAWARAIGLTLAGFWGRHPHLDMLPTRMELLTTYTPKSKTPLEVLNGANPKRAIEYWRGALQWLVDIGYLEPYGEAAISKEEAQKHPRYNWQQDWLKATVSLKPGPRMVAGVAARAANIPPTRAPRVLTERTPRRRRRQRKPVKSVFVEGETS